MPYTLVTSCIQIEIMLLNNLRFTLISYETHMYKKHCMTCVYMSLSHCDLETINLITNEIMTGVGKSTSQKPHTATKHHNAAAVKAKAHAAHEAAKNKAHAAHEAAKNKAHAAHEAAKVKAHEATKHHNAAAAAAKAKAHAAHEAGKVKAHAAHEAAKVKAHEATKHHNAAHEAAKAVAHKTLNHHKSAAMTAGVAAAAAKAVAHQAIKHPKLTGAAADILVPGSGRVARLVAKHAHHAEGVVHHMHAIADAIDSDDSANSEDETDHVKPESIKKSVHALAKLIKHKVLHKKSVS
jgi:DNA polymerase III gamma/tau subunit